MSLTASLHIGRSALTASQTAIQVTGQNLANSATPGYTRQVAHLEPLRGDGTTWGISIGKGVNVADIRRAIDESVQARLFKGVSDQAAAEQRLETMAMVQASLNELGEHDLSSRLSSFFNAWSERANNSPSDATVVQQGEQLAGFMRRLRQDLVDHRLQIDQSIHSIVRRADALLGEVARVNREVVKAEVGGRTASALRDQRDILLTELSGYMDITTREQPSGTVDVLVGSTPVVLAGESRGIEVQTRSRGGRTEIAVAVRADGQHLAIDSGRLGALVSDRAAAVNGTIERLDTLAAQVIFQVNRLHATGANERGMTEATSNLPFSPADRSRALNDPANATLRGLPFSFAKGGGVFDVHVKNTATGATQVVQVRIDLDGLDNSGAPGYADDTSLDDLRAALDAIPGLTADIAPDGRLRIRAEDGHEFSFSNDTSDALALLGVNSYFEGSDAATIKVRDELTADPSRLTVGRIVNGVLIENGTALELANLQDRALAALNNETIPGAWRNAVSDIGVRTAAAETTARASKIVREGLEAQRAGISGVSIDEEAMNMLNYQRTYQGAARFVAAIDEMTQTLLSLV